MSPVPALKPANVPPMERHRTTNLHTKALLTAGSFSGDFRTPAGIRKSQRKRTGGFR